MSEETNNLRVDMYTKLFPIVIEEDQRQGLDGPANFWDDPLFVWDDFIWDEMKIRPIIKDLFFVLESSEVEELKEIDALKDLTDPDKCPEEFLEIMAKSLGDSLEGEEEELRKRERVKSIIHLNKQRGRPISWDIFFRLAGFETKTFPLFKKTLNESQNRYSRTQYVTTEVTETFGMSGGSNYKGKISQVPMKPGSLRMDFGFEKIRDNGDSLSRNFGKFVSNTGSTGEINYCTGNFIVQLSSPATIVPEITYERIDEEFPFKAARVDFEVFLVPTSEDTIEPPIDASFINKVLNRLEEVRPIHVLLRAFIVALKLDEVIPDFATDQKKCGPTMQKDVRDNDETRFYAADQAEVSGEEDIAIVDIETERIVLSHDITDLIVNPDVAVLEFSDGQPTLYI